ncbi:unnamed protein product [Candidula unifasciata]|uniref:Bifunctional coenzyme A synthase n=1 Tax=Candidula unifasciata TaxID=100452 RepID=A0A8S3YKQ8_9EUPU|nr:unnamed protein product [Candidula unifasciata]
MARSGLLILTQPLSHLKSLIPQVVKEASESVSGTLYICLQPALQDRHVTQDSLLQPVLSTQEMQMLIRDFYMSGSKVCHTLDIRVLLSHICPNLSTFQPVAYSLKKKMSVLLSDSVALQDVWNDDKISLVDVLQTVFKNISPDIQFQLLNTNFSQKVTSSQTSLSVLRTFPNVVVGGTFDYLHAGHKLLLNECCLLCDQKLTVGITDGDRNKKKVLWELIEPYADREKEVVRFVTEVKPGIIMEPVKIFDAFGPTKTDPNLDCIVVSQETKEGAKMVNEERLKLGFSQLEVVVIDLIDDVCHTDDEESKVSSSSIRKRLLGTLLRPLPYRPNIPKTPYRIGVSGGIASGKSNVCSELEKFGAKIINCDLLGHKAYVKGTDAYHAIIKEFGHSVLDDNKEINRRLLGSVVFNDKSKLTTLNSIVWPAIQQLAEEEIEFHRKTGATVVVLEAAVLIEAGWDSMVHEIWATFVPREEAIRRVVERNGLSETEAEKRIDSQISNVERIEKSNVVICSLWEYEVTRRQVQKAWSLLQDRIKPATQNKL